DLLAEIDVLSSDLGPGVLIDHRHRQPVEVPCRIDDGPEIDERHRNYEDRHQNHRGNPDRADLERVPPPQRGASLRWFGFGHVRKTPTSIVRGRGGFLSLVDAER